MVRLEKQIYMDGEWMAKLHQHIKDGYVRVQKHPTKDLYIYNYTQKTQSERKWDDITRKCRGLVLNSKGKVIIECPEKFFNQGEPEAAEVNLNNCIISEKLDGYYISIKIDYEYGAIITSRGSFDNKYVRAVHNFLTNNVVKQLPIGYTFFCELLQDFPGDESIIVMKHPTPKLVCWAIKDTQHSELLALQGTWPLDCAQRFTTDEMRKYLDGEVEGVVIQDMQSLERVKVKTDWFIKMHRMISGCTKKRVWEILKDGGVVEDYPFQDELLPQIQSWEHELRSDFEQALSEAWVWHDKVAEKTDKEVGLMEIPHPYKALVFALRKDRIQQAYDALWKTLKP